MKKRSIKIVYLGLVWILGITGCGARQDTYDPEVIIEEQTSVTPTPEEQKTEEQTVIYTDESQKEIVYEELQFNIYPYHVTKETVSNGITTYECEINSDATNSIWEFYDTIRVQRIYDADVHSLMDAILYFEEEVDETRRIVVAYENITDESGIRAIYKAIAEGERYYLVYTATAGYLIETKESIGVEEDLLAERSNAIETAYYSSISIEYETQVERIISYVEKSAIYTITSEEQQTEYKMVLNPIQTEEMEKGYSCELYGAGGELLQSLVWESWATPNCISFAELNGDGCLDMKVDIGRETVEIYVWQNEAQCYEKVIYEGELRHIEPRDGEIWNWIRNSGGGYWIERLAWDGNTLIKVSEEFVLPDDAQ